MLFRESTSGSSEYLRDRLAGKLTVWRHLVIGSRNSWQHGDERGFRSRRHRIHSSGDYKDRPPEEEHARLHRFRLEQAADPIDFDLQTRVVICEQFVLKMRSIGIRIIACAIAERHLHALAHFPNRTRSRLKSSAAANKKQVMQYVAACREGSGLTAVASSAFAARAIFETRTSTSEHARMSARLFGHMLPTEIGSTMPRSTSRS